MKLILENWRQFISEEIEIPAHLKRTVYRQDDDLDKAEYQEIKDAVSYFIDLANQEAPLKKFEELTGPQQKIVQAMGLWTGGYYSVLRNLDNPEERMFMTQSPTISKRKMQQMQDKEQINPVQFSNYSLKQAQRFKITPRSLDESFKLLYVIAQLPIPESFRKPLYRGIKLTKKQLLNYINNKRAIFHGNLQSWTTEGDRALRYSYPKSATESNKIAVVLEIENPLTGTPIMGVSHFEREAEILKAGSLSVISYTQEKNQEGFPYYRIKVKEVNIPPEKTILDKIKTTAKKLFTSKRKFPQGAGAEEYIAPRHGMSTGIPLSPKYLTQEQKNPRIPRKKGQPAKSKKHSDLYTDEDPKGTIHGLGYKDEATARASVIKIRKSNRSHAHKTQAAIAMEQRAKAAGKSKEAAIFRKFIEQQKKKTKAKEEKK